MGSKTSGKSKTSRTSTRIYPHSELVSKSVPSNKQESGKNVVGLSLYVVCHTEHVEVCLSQFTDKAG